MVADVQTIISKDIKVARVIQTFIILNNIKVAGCSNVIIFKDIKVVRVARVEDVQTL